MRIEKMRNLKKAVTVFGLCAAFVACTDPGEKTAIGAATGGAIGAGMGAIIGSQTGDAGTGLVLGAAAGAGTGAMIANAFEAQDEAIRSQDEAIERQEQTLRAQRTEIDELRRMNGSDGGTIRTAPSSLPNSLAPQKAAPIQERNAYMAPPAAAQPQAMRPSQALSDTNVNSGAPSLDEVQPLESSARGSIDASKIATSKSADCSKADEEITLAKGTTEAGDKLFHHRRALRLCPNDASIHNALGELYLSMNRSEDAEFEFKEALRLNPGFEVAKDNLRMVKK